jgi:hypothetical protein
MPINQQLTQDTDIKKFKKKFFKKYGMHLYVYSAGHHDYRVALGVFEDCTLIALKKNNPKYSYMNDLKYKLRERPYLVYTQAMAYLAHIGGHPKSKIGQHINKNHATIINSVKQVENALYTKEPLLNDALNNILKEIKDNVGTVPENIASQLNAQSNTDPIWDKARRFIAKHN